jgi:hypothetical protein
MTTNLGARAGLPDWFSLEGEAFVRQAYQRLLDRPADSMGVQNYTAQLLAGLSKAQLVSELESSPEGRMVARRCSIGAGTGPARAGFASHQRSALAASAAQTSMAQTSMAAAPRHVNDLMDLHGAMFVKAAYLALFKREADAEGLARYVEVLRSGFSRSYVLDALATSPEASEKSSDLPGLRSLLAAYHKAQKSSWGGWYWRNVKGAESDLLAARESRMLAWRNSEG